MSLPRKKLHHYVPRFYLKRWTENDLVYCLLNGEIFRTNIRNVAAENYFYRLKELTPNDTELIHELVIANSPVKLKELQERLLWTFTLPHRMKKQLQMSGNATPSILAGFDKLTAEMNEDLHTSIEEGFKPFLDSMLSGDLRFYSNAATVPAFFSGIAAQYLRTNQIKRARATLPSDRLAVFERIVNILVHILAISVGFSLYSDRTRYEVILLDNATDIPFITADQPVINIAANPKETKPPDKFELYYPLSPTKAMLLVKSDSSHLPGSPSVTPTSVHLYNL